jgi:hypothetical protein
MQEGPTADATEGTKAAYEISEVKAGSTYMYVYSTCLSRAGFLLSGIRMLIGGKKQ